MIRHLFIGLIACATFAVAEIPLQLVAEIQLPARTITWDVQHYEDSTSFGWAAVTEGEAVWGVDSLGNDSLISLAVDTIWYKTRSEGGLEYLLFPHNEYGTYYWSLCWTGLTLLRMQDISGPVVAIKARDYWWTYMYYFDLASDSVIARQTLFHEDVDHETQVFSMESGQLLR